MTARMLELARFYSGQRGVFMSPESIRQQREAHRRIAEKRGRYWREGKW